MIAATGYAIDMGRLAFLDPSLLTQVKTSMGNPILTRDFETSLPGLYVVGPASALSFGPVCRFVFGAKHPARALARRLSAAASRRRAAAAGVGAANWGAAR